MDTIEIRPASVDRFGDVEHALTGGGDGASCWCEWFMLTGAQFDATTRDEKRDMLRTDLAASPTSGLVAYVEGEPAGWVKVSARPQQPRIARSRNLARSPEPMDDPDVWAITCFVVRREHRGRGLTARLLDAAVAHARDHGARIVEGYPIDTSVSSPSNSELFHGALSTFLDAGFTEVARASTTKPIVSLTLD